MSIKVRYLDFPLGIQDYASIEAEQISSYCDPMGLPFGKELPNWASLELGGWPLDGTKALPDPNNWPALLGANTAGVSSGTLGAAKLGKTELGSRDFSFDVQTKVEFLIPNPTQTTGLTFRFAEDAWCTDMQICWYRGAQLLAEEKAHPSGPDFVVHRKVENFDRVVVVFEGMNRPGVLLRLQEFYLGRALVFTQDELQKVELTNEVDPTLSRLSADAMTVVLCDKENRQLEPKQYQKMELYRNGKLIACHSVQSSSCQDHQYTFRCHSPIGDMEKTFLGGFFQGQPLEQALSRVLEGEPFEMDPALEHSVVTGYLPICTQREALQQIAFAVGGVVDTFGTSCIRISAIPSMVTGCFMPEQVFSGGSLQTTPQPARVEVVAHSYQPLEQEETLLDGEDIGTEMTMLTFPQPHWGYTITGAKLVEQGANFLRVIPQGRVTLKAKTYRINQMRCIRTTGGGGSQVQKVENATLVHSGNVRQIADRLLNLCALEQTLQQDAVVEEQRAGQKVVMSTPWKENMYGYITAMQSTFTRYGHTASVTVLGTLQLPAEENLFAGEFYSGGWEVI